MVRFTFTVTVTVMLSVSLLVSVYEYVPEQSSYPVDSWNGYQAPALDAVGYIGRLAVNTRVLIGISIQ